MAITIPEEYRELVGAPTYVTLVTLMPDGMPQASIMWCDYDGEYILINTAQGRQKERNMRARPMATIMGVDTTKPYRYVEVRGVVDEITAEGAFEHINLLAKRYIGVDSYYGNVQPAEMADKETRIICKIKPTRVRIYPPES